jgi:hypothetical protein
MAHDLTALQRATHHTVLDGLGEANRSIRPQVAAAALDQTITRQVLDDFESAPIDTRLRATLRFLRKMTLEPNALTREDARAVLEAGVDKVALTEAIHVAYLFNIYDRLADTMGWDVPDPAKGYYPVAAQRLLKHGYR